MIHGAYRAVAALGLISTITFLNACSSGGRSGDVIRPQEAVVVAESQDRQWTGVAANRSGRIFVNYPRWGGPYRYAVEEILPSGERVPYPDAAVNTWQPGVDPSQRFVCVQSVTVDDDGDLWVLDPANPQFQGVVSGGPKLVRIDLKRDRVAEIIGLDDRLAKPDSYLNDVRIDNDRNFAYLTDSGNGALVVLDLTTGKGRRVLEEHPSTQAEAGVIPEIEGNEWRHADTGEVPQIHADGIALSHDGETLYWQALTGRTLHKIETAVLRDFQQSHEAIERAVERVAHTVVTDGMEIDREGRLYYSALEQNAVIVGEPGGQLFVLTTSPRIDWPDSFAWGKGNTLYFTTAQIHEGAAFSEDGSGPDEPYRLWKVEAP